MSALDEAKPVANELFRRAVSENRRHDGNDESNRAEDHLSLLMDIRTTPRTGSFGPKA
jgi:hypothetical protein